MTKSTLDQIVSFLEMSCATCVKKAQAELAYELQAAKEKQAIKKEEIEIQVVERRAQIAIEEQEIKRREKELEATVKSPAEAEAFKMQTLAEAEKLVFLLISP